jgi:hypothetical protein
MAKEHPITDAALQGDWWDFTAAVRSRIEGAAPEYGDDSFYLPSGRLAREIELELLDIPGWSFILWKRVQALKRKLAALEALAE